MQIGFLQYAPHERGLGENIRFIIKSTAALSRSLLVLPEFFLGSYTNFTLIEEEDLLRELRPLVEHSLNRNLAFVGSAPIQVGNRAFNRSIYINNGEVITSYDKRNLFGLEKQTLNAGERPYQVLNFSNLKFSVQICLDNADPIASHDAVRRHGINLLAAPASVSVSFIRDILKARSLENQIVTIFCNRVGDDDGIYYSGRSSIFFPNGREMAAGSDTDLVLTSISERDLAHQTFQRQSLFAAAAATSPL
jgi:predicted amidohydrolase